MTSEPVSEISEIVAALPGSPRAGQRLVVAIAGPPAAGKSTLAAELAAALGERAGVLGMDAFHYDNAVLEARGLLARKGAIDTFDADGYRRTVETLRNGPGDTIAVPVFDRELELSRNCAEIITPQQDIIVTEGNYLLVQQTPWAGLADLFDLTIWIDVPMEVLRVRLLDRWQSFGFSDQDAQTRAEQNDLPNAEFTVKHSAPADFTWSMV